MNTAHMELIGPRHQAAAPLWGMEGLQGSRVRPRDPAPLRVLLADGDASAAALLSGYLAECGFAVRLASTSREIFEVLARFEPDLVVLSMDLPDEEGLRTCWRIRGCSHAALMLITSKEKRYTGVLGLERGADDCLIRPVVPREVLARARAILRRRGPEAQAGRPGVPERSACYRFGGLCLSTARRELVDASNQIVALTGSEYAMLCALLAARGKVLPRAQLVRDPAVGVTVRAHNIASTMYHLRQKLRQLGQRASIIGTVRSVGYVIRGRIDITYE